MKDPYFTPYPTHYNLFDPLPYSTSNQTMHNFCLPPLTTFFTLPPAQLFSNPYIQFGYDIPSISSQQL